MDDKVEGFSQDLNVTFSEVRAVLDHWALTRGKGWQEYLLVRGPGKEDSFIVLAHPDDKSDFAERLVELHKSEAAQGK